MSLFSTRQDASKPLDRARAWGCLAANLFLWPGLGTAFSGRKIGLIQMGLSAAGLVMTLIGVVGFYAGWIQTSVQPDFNDKYARGGALGFGLFVLVWFWALINSIFILKASSNRKLPPQF